ncbi:MAG: pilM [Glaciihabitans sp.]|nr:pilM [Glaciihabitans sp.]
MTPAWKRPTRGDKAAKAYGPLRGRQTNYTDEPAAPAAPTAPSTLSAQLPVEPSHTKRAPRMAITRRRGSQRIVGLDIGSDALRAVEVEGAASGNPVITAWGQIPLRPGIVDSGEVLDTVAVATLLKKLWADAGFTTTEVVLGIGNPRVMVRDLTVPCAGAQQIRAGLPFHVQDLLTVPVAEALLDFYPVTEAIEDGAPVLHGLLVAAIKETVTTNITAAKLAGLTTIDVDLIPFALSRLFARHLSAPNNAPNNDPSGFASTASSADAVALVDIGARTTTVVVAINAVPQFVRIIPAGGADLSRLIGDALGGSDLHADQLKKRVGLLGPSPRPEDAAAVGIIHQFCGDLLDSIHNTLRYYSNAHPQVHLHQLVAGGGGAQLPGFLDALAEITRLPVILADPFDTITVGRKLGLTPPSLAVALALALGTGLPARRALSERSAA